LTRPQKITFDELRESGVRGVLIYCSDYHCSHSIATSGDDRITSGCQTLSPRFICIACGQRGADIRPHFG
jgi:hypothetical protein